MASSYVPKALSELREYLKPHTGLDNFGLGIVNSETDASYHHGWSQRDTDGSDYSWDEAARDWNWKTNAARALDIGMFDRLRELSLWLVNECASGAADCSDIREIIYSPDGKVVKRWDRLGIRSSGDSSHLTHTHISWFADAENRSKLGPFQRFFGDTMEDFELADTYRLDAILQQKDAAVYTPQWNGGVEVREPNNLKVTLQEILELVSAGNTGGITEARLREIIREEIAKTRLS